MQQQYQYKVFVFHDTLMKHKRWWNQNIKLYPMEYIFPHTNTHHLTIKNESDINTALTIQVCSHNWMKFSSFINSNTIMNSSSCTYKGNKIPNSNLIQRNPTMRDKTMVNHGSSPPNLGLKEATPELGETRFNRDTFNQHYNNKN